MQSPFGRKGFAASASSKDRYHGQMRFPGLTQYCHITSCPLASRTTMCRSRTSNGDPRGARVMSSARVTVFERVNCRPLSVGARRGAALVLEPGARAEAAFARRDGGLTLYAPRV